MPSSCISDNLLKIQWYSHFLVPQPLEESGGLGGIAHTPPSIRPDLCWFICITLPRFSLAACSGRAGPVHFLGHALVCPGLQACCFLWGSLGSQSPFSLGISSSRYWIGIPGVTPGVGGVPPLIAHVILGAACQK